MDYKEIYEMISEWDNYQWEVFAYMNFDPYWITDIDELEFDRNYVKISDFYLLVADEYDADKLHYERCSDLVDDEIPEYLSRYFDYDSFTEDQSRAEMLAGYDGIEHAYCVNDEWIYVYRN